MTDPVRLYRLYSPEFKDFLKGLYRQNDPVTIDVPWLQERGLRSRGEGDFLRAAYCFEAALQLENSPLARKTLLNYLVPCYRKTGQMREAMIIMTRNSDGNFGGDVDIPKDYDILPERGF